MNFPSLDNPESVEVKRNSKFCMEVEFEAKEVDYRLAAAFKAFNSANKLTKELLDKGPSLVESVKLVTSSENELRRDVLVASLGAEGPDCMKNCMDNISQLRKVPSVVEAVKQETEEDFEDLKKAMKIFLEAVPSTPLVENKPDMVPVVEESLNDLQDGPEVHNGHVQSGRGSTAEHVGQTLFVPDDGRQDDELGQGDRDNYVTSKEASGDGTGSMDSGNDSEEADDMETEDTTAGFKDS